MIRLGGTAALALVLAAPAYTIAHADDEYGTGHDTLIRSAAAASARPSSPQGVARSWDYENEREAMARKPAASNQAARLSSTVPMADGKADVVGAGGPQDQLGREIYHPGSGTDW